MVAKKKTEVVPFPEAGLDGAAEMLARFKVRRDSAGGQFYAAVDKHGDRTSPNEPLVGGYGCYGASHDQAKGGTFFVDVSVAAKYHCTPDNRDSFIPYLDYWLNKSFLSHVFISKDPEQVFKDGGTITDATKPANQVVSALMGTRYMGENHVFIRTWNKLVKLGMHPDLASIVAHAYAWHPEKNQEGFIYNAGWGGHSWFQIYTQKGINEEFIARILRRQFVNEQPLNNCTAYWPLCGMAIRDLEAAKRFGNPDWKNTKLNPLMLPDTEVHQIKNSFGKVAKEVQNFFPVTRFDELLAWQNKQLEEAGVRKFRKPRTRKPAAKIALPPSKQAA